MLSVLTFILRNRSRFNKLYRKHRKEEITKWREKSTLLHTTTLEKQSHSRMMALIFNKWHFDYLVLYRRQLWSVELAI
jgi:hypothetical protein